jgi:hypothetical protein
MAKGRDSQKNAKKPKKDKKPKGIQITSSVETGK